MQPNWAEENLQVIRTLMERAGLYRRALAPVMLLVGFVGIGSAIGARYCLVNTYGGFFRWWDWTCLIAFFVALGFARQQAWRAKEPLLTPPTKRVAAALMAPYLIGLVASIPFRSIVSVRFQNPDDWFLVHYLVGFWLMLHGSALNAAGMFISLGVRRLGWVFLLAGAAVIVNTVYRVFYQIAEPHILMGLTFGGFHLLAGIYLYFTEKREPTP